MAVVKLDEQAQLDAAIECVALDLADLAQQLNRAAAVISDFAADLDRLTNEEVQGGPVTGE
jgi:hypothetical protein